MRSVLIVHHKVADFDAWKKVYDTVGDMQKAGGVIEQAVLRNPQSANDVVVVHTFPSTEAAQAFLGMAELKEAMMSAGVDPATMRVEILEEVSAGPV